MDDDHASLRPQPAPSRIGVWVRAIAPIAVVGGCGFLVASQVASGTPLGVGLALGSLILGAVIGYVWANRHDTHRDPADRSEKLWTLLVLGNTVVLTLARSLGELRIAVRVTWVAFCLAVLLVAVYSRRRQRATGTS